VSRAAAGLRAERRIALTGTPVENRLLELWALLQLLNPGLLGSLSQFRQRFALPIERDHDPEAAERLRRLTAPFLLRRLKSDPAILPDLPGRIEQTELCTLSEEQATLYQAVADELLEQAEQSEGIARQGLVLAGLTRLKQVCNFDTHSGESAKLDCLKADLEEVQASGRKALVFSQWVETLGKLEKELTPFGALQYHGGMSTAARDEAIQRFKNDRRHSVLLLSYGAGAVGLNLQFSQYVFLFDRWWNPAVEDQAVNRAHRIGAAGAVTVTRYLAADTIEERIDEVLRRKRDLSDMILSQAGVPAASGLTQDDLFALFKLAPPRAPAIRAAA
jgi:SNF2 family DNA or RNA helicase